MKHMYARKSIDFSKKCSSKNLALFLLLISFCLSQELAAQTTIYSEDFSTNTGKGQNGPTLDTTGVSNWKIDVSNYVTPVASADYFKVISGRFESWNTDATSTLPVYWFSTIQCISGYSAISLSTVLGRTSSNSTSGVEGFYRIHNGGSWGTWTSYGSLVSSGTPNPKTISASSLSGDSIQIRIAHWGTSNTPFYYHDDVAIVATGTSTCGGPPCVPDSATINTTNSATMCNGDVRALTGTPGSGSWTLLSGPGSIAGNDLTATGIGTIQVVYTAGNCNLKDTVSIESKEVPTASIVSLSSNLCDNHTRTLVGTPAGGTFSIVSGPASITGDVLTPTGAGTVNIEYLFSNGACSNLATQSFTIITDCPDNAYVGTWDAMNFYSAAPCTWSPQDGNYIGTLTHPYASLEAGVNAVDNIANSTLIFQPDAYVGSYDYDTDGNNESCSGSSIANVFNITAADNGLRIFGVEGGCGTLIDLSEGGSSTTDFIVANGVNGLVIKDMYFKSWGQVIELVSCNNVLIERCVFDDCDHGEPAVIIYNSTNVTFKNCTFINSFSTSGYKQTELTGTSNNITFSNCTWACNEDPGNEGGAVLVECDGRVNFDDCTFSGNVSNGSSGDGGAMTIQKRTGGLTVPTVNFNGGSFCNNISEATTGTVGGGAINIKGGKVTIDGTSFYGNKTLANGGAILFSDKDETLVIKNAIFEADTANGNGGALYISNETTVEIINSYFLKNKAAGGGAIYVNAGPEAQASAGIATLFSMSNTSVTQNTSTGSNAGGIHFQASDNNEDSDAVPNSDAFSISQSKIWANVSTGSYDDVTENYYWCSFCSGALADPALSLDASSIVGEGRSLSFGFGTESTIWTQGDTSVYSVGWTSSYLEAPCADVDCGVAFCALTIPASCFAATYLESSNSICTDTSATGMISGQVWIDLDQDGIQALGEIGHADVAGLVVQIFDDNGYAIGFTTTNASGFYSFSGLPAGNFTIRIQNPDVSTYASLTSKNETGSTESTDSDADAIINDTILSGFNLVGGQINITLSAAEIKTDLDAGFVTSDGSISGIVFFDDDLDAISDSDPLHSSVTLSLYTCGENEVCGDIDDRLVETTSTNGSGAFSFNSLPLYINYYIHFEDSVNNDTTQYYRVNQVNASDYSAANNDSDAESTSGTTATIVLSTDIPNIANINQGLSLIAPTPLPVELLSFSVKQIDDCQGEIEWITLSEINNDFFSILKSQDGIHFSLLAKVKGNGNSNQTMKYTYVDSEKTEGTVYYKLQQFDFDGKNSSHGIISFKPNCNNSLFEVSCFPNPIQNELNLTISSKYLSEILIELQSLDGKLHLKEKIEIISLEQNIVLPTTHLLNGVYFLKVVDKNANQQIHRIIKL